MPRPLPVLPFLVRAILAAAVMTLPAALPSEAAAETYKVSGHRVSQHGFHAPNHRFFSGQRSAHSRFGRHGGFGPRFAHSKSFGSNIAIVIAAPAIAGNQGASAEPAGEGAFYIEEGVCAPGRYCTLRLGRASNAPKIITLNASGGAISCISGQCGAVQ